MDLLEIAGITMANTADPMYLVCWTQNGGSVGKVMKKIKNVISNNKYWINQYDHENNTERVGVAERGDFLARIVQKNSGCISSILELGCSSGGNLLRINKLCPEIKLTGMDISERAIEYGYKQEHNQAELVCGDLTDPKWPELFGGRKFDLVFTSGVLCYLDTQAAHNTIDVILAMANKFIVHIERQAKNKTIKTTKNDYGILYMNGFRFHQWYEDHGLYLNIKDLREVGGMWAQSNFCYHYMWANLTQEVLMI